MLSDSLDKQMNQALKPLGLNLSQFAIMMVLIERDDISQSDIGRQVLMASYATTRNIDVLVKMGLVQRHPHRQSRRSINICVTEQGTALAGKLINILREVNQALLQPLDEAEQETLKKLLPRLI